MLSDSKFTVPEFCVAEIGINLMRMSSRKTARLARTDRSSGSLFPDNQTTESRSFAAGRSAFDSLRWLIGRLGDTFELTPRKHDARHALMGRFTTLWAHLEDCRSHKLKGYGSVDPELRRTLDPTVRAMTGAVDQILSALGKDKAAK